MDIRRALIVDDSKLVCFKLGKMLEEKGIPSHAVGSGEEALAYLGANHLPDVVFVDIMMPGMDGYQTIEAIRAQPALAHLPLIMCSSNDTDEDRAQAQRRGANGFLPKPPSPERLSRILSSLSPVISVPAPALVSTAPAPTPALVPTAPAPTPPPAGDIITAEVAARLIREAVEAAERAVHVRMEDLTHRLALETEEAARRVASSIAAETARTVAQRTAAETATQTGGENARQVAVQAAREVVRTLVPELVQERVRMIASTMMPALAEQTIQEASEHLAPEILRQLAAPAAEATLRAALPGVMPGVISEVTTRLRENLRTDLARELSEKVGHAAATLLEGESFRQSMTRTVRSVAENIADQTARSVAEATTRAILEHSLAQAAGKSSPSEQTAQEALHQIEALTSQLRTTQLALGAGLAVVILYLLTKLFI